MQNARKGFECNYYGNDVEPFENSFKLVYLIHTVDIIYRIGGRSAGVSRHGQGQTKPRGGGVNELGGWRVCMP